MAAETTQAQCHAVTADGERCERPAGEDGFCHQHDESDETVEEYEGADDTQESADDSSGDSSDEGSTNGESANGESRNDDGTSDESRGDGGTSTGSDSTGSLDGVREVRETIQSLAPDVIGREFDAVIEVDDTDDGWRAVVELVERRAVPDTQDILGRYEVDLEGDSVTGYRRLDRYRRGDTDADEPR